MMTADKAVEPMALEQPPACTVTFLQALAEVRKAHVWGVWVLDTFHLPCNNADAGSPC